MLRHKYSVFIFFVLLAILFLTKASMFFYEILFLTFLVITTWGAFDMRLNYFTKAICKSNSIQKKNIAITFDDGPHEKTSEILDILMKYNAKATFFCIGKQIEKHPEILKRILNEGHIVGNHSYSHSKWNGFFSTQKNISEIEQTNTLVSQLVNKKIRLFRPPFGVTNPNISRAVAKTNQIVIGWNIRSLDTVIESENAILNRIKNRVKPGGIILLHDTSAKTVSVLEQLLLFLQSESYETVTIEELLEIPAYEN
ncbi:MAG: polysaccharide deacetylase family protein [Flavobacterium sp.]|nr:polysaccharide deacetylase family protein [Flavobacterium sp.]